MTVFENVAYPLKVQKKKVNKANELLEIMGLSEYGDRSAMELSGGQQQRVALARALVTEPDVLLLDEPFSNLDVKLREQMRVELKLIQQRLGLTVILVTHDQLDAFSLSDRIGVMRNGSIEQIDNATTIYERPRTSFVRDFLGSTVKIDGIVIAKKDGVHTIQLQNHLTMDFPEEVIRGELQLGDAALVTTRPEDIEVKAQSSEVPPPNSIVGLVETAMFQGNNYECSIRIDESREIHIFLPRTTKLKVGDKLWIQIDPNLSNVWSQ
jgi:ABC-type Fe3+/spermidine/putrescine transport system ATPase subunit